jgi:hypothetical protein
LVAREQAYERHLAEMSVTYGAIGAAVNTRIGLGRGCCGDTLNSTIHRTLDIVRSSRVLIMYT